MGTIQMKMRWWIGKPRMTDVQGRDGHWVVTDRRDSEQYLWSSNGRIPEIGEMVTVTRNGFGESKVVGYFSENGYLGLIVEPVKLPDWYVKQVKQDRLVKRDIDPAKQICVFGAEIGEVQR